MINLAGVRTCDETITKELSEAGVDIVGVGKMKREVPASIIGKCNNFIFTRNWYYWVVSGYMPLAIAKEIYAKYKSLNIRVAGHCGNPPPEEWSEPKNYAEKRKVYFEQWRRGEITLHELNKKGLEIRTQGEQFITHYHIDTQEGLNRFVEIIKANNVIG